MTDCGQASCCARATCNWPGSFTNDTGTLVVNGNGTFSTTTSLGCRLSAAFTPRASGKNVYDITVTFGAAPCGLPNGSAAGNAIITNLTSGQRQLTVAVTTADGANGGAFSGNADVLSTAAVQMAATVRQAVEARKSRRRPASPGAAFAAGF